MHRFSFVLLIVGLFLTGCKPGQHPVTKDSDGQGSFYVDSIKGDAERGQISTKSSWRVPTAVDMSLQVCLRDRTSRKELMHQKFFVQIPGTTTGKEVETNVSGCFTYEEPLNFNYFAGRSGWVLVKREIIGLDVNEGKRVIELAVNPWAVGYHSRDSGKAVVFMRDGDSGFRPKQIYSGGASVTQFLAGDHSDQGAAKLIIQDLQFKVMPESERTGHIGLRYMIEMRPRIKSQKFNGDDSYEDIQDGEFDVEMQLLSVNTGANMDQKALILDPGIKSKDLGRVIDGKMRTEIMIDQDLQANQGNLELAVRITPRTMGINATIQPFNSLYRLGAGTMADSGSGWQSMKCDTGSECDFDRVVRSAVNFGQSHKQFAETNPYFLPNDRYSFTKLNLGFFMVKAGETATQRTIMYTASTCITDKQTGTKLANTPMIVRYLKQKKLTNEERAAMEARGEPLPEDQHDEIEKEVIPKSTDANGCLNWDGLVFHKYYKPEQYFERNIEIEKPSGFKQQFRFYLNPWDTNIYFGRDNREFTNDSTYQEIKNRKKIKSRFFVGGYSYHTVRFLYNIDPFMDLEVKKTVLLEVTPQVLRYSGIKDARKMTEHLRDGIYLMKLGIQKSYLDPRDNSKLLLHQTAPGLEAQVQSIGPETLATKHFVTTNTALVRVVDGIIIYPVELTMRDLRLMRVRSNFLIELQTVDERLVQAYHKFKDFAIDRTQLETAIETFKNTELNKEPISHDLKSEGGTTAPGLQNLVERRDREGAKDPKTALLDLKQRTDAATQMVTDGVKYLKQQLTGGGLLGSYLNSAGQNTNVPYELTKGASINSNFELNQDLLLKLKEALAVNDFSELKLPKAEDIDLNLFLEDDSGLEGRTFVGPVIFLSNAYSDSVRATDNLDEEKCEDSTHRRDALARAHDLLAGHKLTDEMRTEMADVKFVDHVEDAKSRQFSDALNNKRQNNAYQYNEYFGSLSHLCYKSVDQLIEEEKTLRMRNNDLLIASSLKSNFIKSFNFDMDFVSLTNEPMLKVKEGCTENVMQCLVETKENVLSVGQIGAWVNHRLENAQSMVNSAPNRVYEYFKGVKHQDVHNEWKPEEYGKLFFERTPDTAVAICNLLANRIASKLSEGKLSDAWPEMIREQALDACTVDGGLLHDLKYHIERTGDYTFLGGLNLNINVGDSFGMGWSRSWGVSTELSDFLGFFNPGGLIEKLGLPLGAVNKGAEVVNRALKPFNMKFNSGMSESNGTSIGESTYLVSQIAKFDVDLLGYEKCAVVRISDLGYGYFKYRWALDLPNVAALLDDAKNYHNPKNPNDDVERIVKGGLMICEGDTRKNNPVKTVEEMYFYFTQHFTEGDMLDQAELYNHPWLLAMRGMRDFNVFVNKIRTQQSVNVQNFVKGLFNVGYERPKAWALDHMSRVYAQVLPSFPGYYTILDPEEDISAFLLQQSRGMWEKRGATDPNKEVTRPDVTRPAQSALDGPLDPATLEPLPK